jgi:hypothetical protein
VGGRPAATLIRHRSNDKAVLNQPSQQMQVPFRTTVLPSSSCQNKTSWVLYQPEPSQQMQVPYSSNCVAVVVMSEQDIVGSLPAITANAGPIFVQLCCRGRHVRIRHRGLFTRCMEWKSNLTCLFYTCLLESLTLLV